MLGDQAELNGRSPGARPGLATHPEAFYENQYSQSGIALGTLMAIRKRFRERGLPGDSNGSHQTVVWLVLEAS